MPNKRILTLVLICALALPATAQASTTIGPNPANPNPLGSQAINWPSDSLLFTAAAPPGVQLTAPSAGVITRWRMYTDDVGTGASVQLRTLLPEAADSYRVIASGPVEPVAQDEETDGPENHNLLHEFTAHVPIGAGQIVGYQLRHAEGSFFEAVLPASIGKEFKYGCLAPGCKSTAPADGAAGLAQFIPEQSVALNADIEPDIDGDLLGDETQDSCVGVCAPPAPPPATTPVVKKKCKKGKKLKRGKCVKKKHKKHKKSKK